MAVAMTAAAPSLPSPWSAVARKDALAPPQPPRVLESLSSREGITVAVVDANALITTASRLLGLADQFVTVKEVLEEVRDPSSRMQLAALPVTVDCMEPSEEALGRVVQFARDTGDLQSLSDVDLKLLALSFTLEEQAHGSAHLRTRPPPLHVTQVRSVREQELPGWGSNVPNLEEWEEISEELDDGSAQELSGVESHVLGITDLSLDTSRIDISIVGDVQNHSDSEAANAAINKGRNEGGEAQSGQVEESLGSKSPRRRRNKKAEPNLEGKLMVAVGLDASKGEVEESIEGGDWQRAISRSTRRKYDKRAARAAIVESSALEQQSHISQDGAVESKEEDRQSVQGEQCQLLSAGGMGTHLLDANRVYNDKEQNENSFSYREDGMKLKVDSQVGDGDGPAVRDVKNEAISSERSIPNDEDFVREEEGISVTAETSVRSTTENETLSTPNDGAESEQSWMLRPLSKSSVACITADFAMQNVLLQIGLRVLSPNGLQVHQLHRWVLKCEACNNVTPDVGRIFCPKCGNGGTLYKVSTTVGPNGVVHTGRRRRTNIRGTRYSLPMPKAGRSGVTQNPILREDQLPQKLLHPKQKKVSIALQGQDVFTNFETFAKNSEKKGHSGPPVREALAIFSGKRNPNDRRFSHKH